MAQQDPKQLAGAWAGGIGGGLFGGKLGIAISIAVAGLPVIGPALAATALIGTSAVGAVLGAKAGKQNPAGGFFSMLTGIFFPWGSNTPDSGHHGSSHDASLPYTTTTTG